MVTNLEFVSRVMNNLKSLSKDAHISRRFILNVGRVKASFLVAQKLDEMTLFLEEDISVRISCMKMEEVSVIDCPIVELRSCRDIMRSKCELPKLISGKNGVAILSVSNIDATEFLTLITERKYAGLKKRKLKYPTQKYFLYKNGYLYIPDLRWEYVSISMLSMEGSKIGNGCDCNDEDDENCTDVWGETFNCPDRLLEIVASQTLQELASIYRTSIEDENPNLDVNVKSTDAV